MKENEIKKAVVTGKFDTDTPMELTDAKIYKNNDIACKVNWKIRNDQLMPEPSYYHINVIRKNCPQLLIDFLLKQINIIDPDNRVDMPDYVLKN